MFHCHTKSQTNSSERVLCILGISRFCITSLRYSCAPTKLEPRSDQQTFGCPPKHANRQKAIGKVSVDLSVREAAWPSGQRVGLAIRRSRVQVPLWPLAGFVLGRHEFKSSAILVNSQLVASYQLRFLILLCCIELVVSKYLNGVPVN